MDEDDGATSKFVFDELSNLGHLNDSLDELDTVLWISLISINSSILIDEKDTAEESSLSLSKSWISMC